MDSSDNLILQLFNNLETVEVVLLQSQQFCECFQFTAVMFCISQRDGMSCGSLGIHFDVGTLVDYQEGQSVLGTRRAEWKYCSTYTFADHI